MSGSLDDFQRTALKKRRAELIEEYQVASKQQGYTLSAVDKLKLQRETEALLKEIRQIEAQLGSIPKEINQIKTGSSDFVVEHQGTLEPNYDPSLSQGNRWAILVGANQYTNYPHLHVCVRDVTAIYQQLLEAHYDPGCIRLMTDDTDPQPTRPKILATLKQLANTATRDDLILFYFSGHGDVVDGESYLVPRETEMHALEYTAINLREAVNILNESKARSKIIFLDACHSGANFGGKGPRAMPPDFIERVFQRAQGQIVLASCQQGEYSYEWHAQERSVFTHFLLEALKGKADFDNKGLITVQDINRYVSNEVRKWAFQRGKSQTPTLQGTMSGDIALVYL